MRDINHLLKKYQKQVPGEMRGKKYEQKKKQQQRLREKHQLTDEIGKLMFLRETEIETVHYLINKCVSFKKLHGRASNETIITALCFMIIKLRKPQAKLYEYKVCNLYGLTLDVFLTIQTRVLGVLLSSAPLTPVASVKYDHNVLLRQSRRQAEQTVLKEKS